MKKTASIVLIIALFALVLCFAACGNNTAEDNITSMENNMTSMLDDATTLMEELSSDLDEALSGNETTGEMTTDDVTTDEATTGGLAENTTTDKTAAGQ